MKTFVQWTEIPLVVIALCGLVFCVAVHFRTANDAEQKKIYRLCVAVMGGITIAFAPWYLFMSYVYAHVIKHNRYLGGREGQELLYGLLQQWVPLGVVYFFLVKFVRTWHAARQAEIRRVGGENGAADGGTYGATGTAAPKK